MSAFPAWVNGRLVAPDAPSVAATDDGLLVGLGVFETLAVEEGVALFLGEHLRRMADGGAALGLTSPAFDAAAAVPAFLREARIERAALRITWTRGPSGGGPTLVFTAREMPEPGPEVSLGIAPHRKDPADPFERVKTTNRARATLARESAAREGAFDALVSTVDGDFAEGTVCNLFAANPRGRVLTPSLDRGVLDGTVRRIVVDALRAAGLAVREGRVERADLDAAEEVFVTNSLVGVLPVASIAGIPRRFAGARGAAAVAAGAGYRAAVARTLRAARESAARLL